MKKILIIGATSAIANACAREWAKKNAEFFLVARNAEKLQNSADDLIARGAKSVKTFILDVNNIEAHPHMLDTCFKHFDEIDIALIAHGTLPNQTACERSVDLTLQEIGSNGLSVISLLTLLANYLELQKSGTIAVISSVAGDRGRPSNYVYGTAKAMVTTFCEGLRGRLFKAGVHLLTIKPGFVDTPMTKTLSLPKMLVVKPEKVAKDIYAGIENKKNTIYTPFFWWGIMNIIKLIPGNIFKRINL